MNYLQQPQPPGDAVPETITLPDGSEKVLWFDAKGEPAKLGQPVTAADRQAWLGKLRLSGRFIKQACRFEPGGDGCVARFQLVEYKRAAPLDREASPEQQALLRARAWLLGEWHAGREIRVRATNQASHRLAVPLAEGVVEVASGYQGPGLFPSPGAVIDDAARFAWTPLRATASPRVLVQFGNRTVDDVPHLTDGALDALRVVAPSSGLGQLLGQITGHGQRLAGQLVTKIRRAAGFADEGIPLIIDSHSMRRGMAEQLRARGYNVRTVTEIFGTDPGDPAIKSLAETLGGRVLTNNMTDFGRDIAIGIDPRATTADTWIRILQEALGK